MTQFKVGDEVCVSGVKCKITRETNKFLVVGFQNIEIKFNKSNYLGYGHYHTLRPIEEYYKGLPKAIAKLKEQRDSLYRHYILCYDNQISRIEAELEARGKK